MDPGTAAGAAGDARHADAGWLVKITGTTAYDYSIRVLFLLWYGFVADRVWGDLLGRLRDPAVSGSRALFLASAAAHVVVLVFFATLVAFTMLRRRPVAKCAGLAPRLAAGAGTFMLMVLPLFPRHALSADMDVLTTLVVMTGNGLAVYVVFWLGRSISIMPEARRLVTGGPYRYLRHPLYLAEELAVVGIFVQYASPWTALIFCAHGSLQLLRMSYEERVLARAFPADYAAYAGRTARLVPGLY